MCQNTWQFCGFWGSKLRSYACMVSTLPVELPPSPKRALCPRHSCGQHERHKCPSKAFIQWPYKPVVLKYSYNIYLAKERKMVFYYTNCITNLNSEYKWDFTKKKYFKTMTNGGKHVYFISPGLNPPPFFVAGVGFLLILKGWNYSWFHFIK